MPDPQNMQHAFDVLKIAAEQEYWGEIVWHVDGDTIRFYANVNDLFWWGSADTEEVTTKNIGELRQAIADLDAVGDDYGSLYGLELFACRVRKMRLQNAAYPKNKAVWPLFDAAGPERPDDIGNPYRLDQRPGYTEKEQQS